jgi:hypothetical protein
MFVARCSGNRWLRTGAGGIDRLVDSSPTREPCGPLLSNQRCRGYRGLPRRAWCSLRMDVGGAGLDQVAVAMICHLFFTQEPSEREHPRPIFSLSGLYETSSRTYLAKAFLADVQTVDLVSESHFRKAVPLLSRAKSRRLASPMGVLRRNNFHLLSGGRCQGRKSYGGSWSGSRAPTAAVRASPA